MSAPIKVYNHQFWSDIKTEIYVNFDHRAEIVNITEITYDLNMATKQWVERERKSYDVIYKIITEVSYEGGSDHYHQVKIRCNSSDNPNSFYYHSIQCDGISEVMNLYTIFTIILDNRKDNK